MTLGKNKLSFVIPCYGSEKTIISVLDEIVQTVNAQPEWQYEIICVNDASPDNVLSVLKDALNSFGNLTIIDLSKNMGKHSAVMAGYSMITGDIVVNLDDDGQCPLEHLWDLIDKMNQGYDFVSAKYPVKQQSLMKNLGSKVNQIMSSRLLGKPKDFQFSNFNILSRFLVDEMLRYKNAYPYLDGLILRVTRRIANVEMEERERLEGEGYFTLRKSISLMLNGFTAFSVKPLRIASFVGFIVAFVGFLAIIAIVVRFLTGADVLMGYSSTISVMLFIGGCIMMILGLIGEYIGRIYISLNNSPQYVIRKLYKNEK